MSILRSPDLATTKTSDMRRRWLNLNSELCKAISQGPALADTEQYDRWRTKMSSLYVVN